MTFRVEALGADHDLEPFDCGNPDLDGWLKRHAFNARGQGTRTYVLIEVDSGSVAGYFALAPHLVTRDEAPKRISRGAPAQIPAILLAKLALDRRFQRRGLGAELLVHALVRIVDAAKTAGGKLVLVDAIDESAAAFYEHHDFVPFPDEGSRLVMKISTAAKALGLPWP